MCEQHKVKRPIGIDLYLFEPMFIEAYETTRCLVNALQDEQLTHKRRADWLEGAEETLETDILPNPKIFGKALSDAEKDEYRRTSRSRMIEAFREQTEQRVFTVINLGVAEQCSIFEQALQYILETAMHHKVRELFGTTCSMEEKQKPLSEVSTQGELVTHLVYDKLSRFGWKSVKKQLNALIREIGLEKSKLFDLSSLKPPIPEAYADRDDRFLEEIFDLRHSIVHDRKRPIRELEDLNYICIFLKILIKRWSLFTVEATGMHHYVLGTGPFKLPTK